ILLWVVFVIGCGFYGISYALDITGTWDTNYKVMFFWQNDTFVAGEYTYENGVLIGALNGNTLRGWWRESKDPRKCGPDKEWSGALAFNFSSDGSSFTGDWNTCADDKQLNPNAKRWTGTKRTSTVNYTQTDCEKSGRFWCNGTCSLTSCTQLLTEQSCLLSGRNWCNGLCQISSCSETIIQSDCELSGKYWCNGICQQSVCSENDESENDEIDVICLIPANNYDDGFNAGKQACINNPASCGITISDSAIPVSGNCMANYSVVGQLHVPCVSVSDAFGGITVYNIMMNQQTGSFTFDLDMGSIKPR
ncbi:MAG: hypothetical protein DRQ41_11075, partial [Gammaproteobacteria bacterium]